MNTFYSKNNNIHTYMRIKFTYYILCNILWRVAAVAAAAAIAVSLFGIRTFAILFHTFVILIEQIFTSRWKSGVRWLMTEIRSTENWLRTIWIHSFGSLAGVWRQWFSINGASCSSDCFAFKQIVLFFFQYSVVCWQFYCTTDNVTPPTGIWTKNKLETVPLNSWLVHVSFGYMRNLFI